MKVFCANRLRGLGVLSFLVTISLVTQAQVSLLSRGPYLQKLTSSSITIRWNTLTSVDSKVNYGTAPDQLTGEVSSLVTTNDHHVEITGLQPYTKYYYSIGSAAGLLQGDADNYFVTAPVPGSEDKYTFWVTGDCGNNSTNQKNVLEAYNTYMGSKPTNVWLTLGDNAYQGGFDAEFKINFFDIYEKNISKHAPLFPAPGNHDYNNNPIQQYTHLIDYYTIFDLPSNGESGGVASGTEAFYSYDYGNVHFLALDSYGVEDLATRLYDTLGKQSQWIKADLEANTKPWVIAYWHHPPYTMASHNSDTEGELVDMREMFIPYLEGLGVDLVLCGHSHGYERSHLMKGHTGMEATFDAAIHNVDQSTAYYDGSPNSCAYQKDERHTQDGTVYIVAGSAGQLGGQQATFPHDALSFADVTNGGSLVLEVEGNRLDAKFLCTDGVLRDNFTIIKNANRMQTVQLVRGETATLTAAWVGNHIWNHSGETSRSVDVRPSEDTYYAVTDNYQCVTDTFFVDVIEANSTTEINGGNVLSFYPNPATDELRVEASSTNNGFEKLTLTDFSGRIILTRELNGDKTVNLKISLNTLPKGIYLVQLNSQTGETVNQKLVIQ